ncbi:hypothetical protein NMY22_g16577 [Coprinellus aureogranulatus]|nr:hypothetical protein NMY22_g16577 [Coprinellus aureogranulatus]
MDATRVKDQSQVMLKRLRRDGADPPEEAEIMQYFSSAALSAAEENHCIPLLACLEPPDDEVHVILVMPVLRPYHDPDFETVGEGLDFIRQMLEGFTFLHQHRVAHRDIRSENLMMDASGIYTEKWYPWDIDRRLDYTGRISPRFTRTERPPKYYIIDYGFSKQYSADDMPPSELPMLATDQTVPEFQGPGANEPCDPFPVDVYTLGNLIRTDFMDGNPENRSQNGRLGFEFLRPLVAAMIAEEPSERVTMAGAVVKLEEIIKSLPSATLRLGLSVSRGGSFKSPMLPSRCTEPRFTGLEGSPMFSTGRGLKHTPTFTFIQSAPPVMAFPSTEFPHDIISQVNREVEREEGGGVRALNTDMEFITIALSNHSTLAESTTGVEKAQEAMHTFIDIEARGMGLEAFFTAKRIIEKEDESEGTDDREVEQYAEEAAAMLASGGGREFIRSRINNRYTQRWLPVSAACQHGVQHIQDRDEESMRLDMYHTIAFKELLRAKMRQA